MKPNRYGPGSRGIGRSVPVGDREDYVPSELYPSQIRRIQRESEEKAEKDKMLKAREKFGNLRRNLEHQ
ncbi:MAG: hypothetical protein AABY03_01685 [Nanoarchaeota archaeon]